MKSRRESKRPPVSKGGFETDQPLKLGVRYHFIFTPMPGAMEESVTGELLEETATEYVIHATTVDPVRLPIDRVLEVNLIYGE